MFVLLIPIILLAAKFEVASIRPAAGDSAGIRLSGNRVDIKNWTLRQLILKAYGLETYQISGPAAIDSTRFDVSCKRPAESSSKDVPEMLRELLADRFGLTTHRESRMLSGSALEVAKSGVKVKLASSGESTPAEGLSTLDDLMGDGAAYGLKPPSVLADGTIRMEFTRLPIRALAQIVGSYLRQPVFDKTGLTGRYEGTLDLNTSDNLAPDPLASLNRLGLRLTREKGAVEVLVVDKVSAAPTAN